ncbi:hypothetical protein BAZMOX_165749_0 [methanotrophic endosymbiont of Bathymodiolus azoricus (Menez Gwen)]|nr:hypothetical protein BAZMOX_165749_0 [methanotrophic endosymbiont of Bathymodiolus azoricus (Menez Gwen)]
MNTATKIPGLPALTADFLQSSDCLVDNLFADLWKSMGMNALLSKAGGSVASISESEECLVFRYN